MNSHGGFQLAFLFRTFLNAAFHTNSAANAPARRAAFGFAECGRRRLSPPPHTCCPLRGQQGAAHSLADSHNEHSFRFPRNIPHLHNCASQQNSHYRLGNAVRTRSAHFVSAVSGGFAAARISASLKYGRAPTPQQKQKSLPCDKLFCII